MTGPSDEEKVARKIVKSTFATVRAGDGKWTERDEYLIPKIAAGLRAAREDGERRGFEKGRDAAARVLTLYCVSNDDSIVEWMQHRECLLRDIRAVAPAAQEGCKTCGGVRWVQPNIRSTATKLCPDCGGGA